MNAPRWCNDTDKEEQKYSKKITVPAVTLSTTNPTQTCLQLEPDLISESFVVWGGHTYDFYFSEFLEILSRKEDAWQKARVRALSAVVVAMHCVSDILEA